MHPTHLREKIIDMIAEELYKVGIYPDSDNDNRCMIDENIQQVTKNKIVALYRDLNGNDVQFTANTNQLPEYNCNLWALMYGVIWEDIERRYCNEVGHALYLKWHGTKEQQKDNAVIDKAERFV